MPKDSTPPVEDKTDPGSPGFEWITAAVTPSVVMATEDKGSFKPPLAEEKGKGPADFEEANKVIEDDTPHGEGSFGQDLGGQRYQFHHAAGKMMGAKLLVSPNNLDTLRGVPFLGVGQIIICIVALEMEVCRYMAANVGFPKLEAMLSIMYNEDFSDCLPHTHLKVTYIDFCFLASGCFDEMTYSSLLCICRVYS